MRTNDEQFVDDFFNGDFEKKPFDMEEMEFGKYDDIDDTYLDQFNDDW
ncbi:hypothetical protein [Aureibacter tunicatorum]|uniref:Uncharacterized protein n=1 Tax=Aureibacter tunicatorum TaxID=866807 RepID=A0AAE3XNA6_9BACT|nr:hypothetical protein [Aureibacter tunicatorum]MDR6239617.1 hypothetical protein [Aureibacter tunicatorum]BDD04094.1 hypothetical protein AUTU_15770 [Aureibacter tunicatorum]